MAENEKFLRVAETYLSLQGEGRHVGLPCFFVRTAGCDLRCSWCDTPQALEGKAGRWWSRQELLAAIPAQVRLVQITGGEPMLQKQSVIELCQTLAVRGQKVLLETGGHRDLKGLPETVHIVMDIKLAGSGEQQHDFAAQLPALKPGDEIKFVIASRDDFEEAMRWLRQEDLVGRFEVLFSPAWGLTSPATLAGWLLETGLPARMQLQQHKYIWGAGTQLV